MDFELSSRSSFCCFCFAFLAACNLWLLAFDIGYDWKPAGGDAAWGRRLVQLGSAGFLFFRFLSFALLSRLSVNDDMYDPL
jgi:hypothetical protein